MMMCRTYDDFFMYSYIQQQENSSKFKFCMCTVNLKFVNMLLFCMFVKSQDKARFMLERAVCKMASVRDTPMFYVIIF
jgi:hypothetical protein